ncbi:hypothetical protein THOM_3252 [Trachipleistophora hominis]|uniref:Uncharacterized protein n=1 Tax=Trachipleistophora hominis TaxID=72359 RepID=L7JT03_TRAHO|nr:hypothetical protein THOM_3252 [Trachipleistophora hominis]
MHNERSFMNEPSFTHTINSRTTQNLCLSRAMIPYKTNTSFKDHLRSSALHSNVNPDLTIFQGNMHLFPYVFSASNIFTFSYTNQITIFHYLGKIFYSKPSYKDHNYFDNKTVIKFLFENYLLFYDYDDAFCDDLSLLYARHCYELITHMAYHIKNRRAGQFISFKPPCQSPIHLHYKNEFEDLS